MYRKNLSNPRNDKEPKAKGKGQGKERKKNGTPEGELEKQIQQSF